MSEPDLVARPELALVNWQLWRNWAQFVWLGGGDVTATDNELRQAVCAKCDAAEGRVQFLSESHLAVVKANIALAERLNQVEARAQQLEAALTAMAALPRYASCGGNAEPLIILRAEGLVRWTDIEPFVTALLPLADTQEPAKEA